MLSTQAVRGLRRLPVECVYSLGILLYTKH